MASVDQNGTFVPPVPLVCNGNRALHMSFWRTDGDWHSSVTLQNIAPEDNEVEVTISYPGGTYLLEKSIPAGEAAMVSINELQQLQTPDREGRRIPAGATFGGLNIWSRNVNNGLVINAMTMSPVTKTCGSCGATGYVNSYALTDSYGCTSGFQTYPVGQSVNLMMSIHWSTSNCSYENPQLNSSSNTGVVNMSLLAVGPGSTSLQATSYQSYPRDISCSSYYHLTSTSGVSVIPITPTKLVRFDYTAASPGAPSGYGPLLLTANTNNEVRDVTNAVKQTNQCGAYRNLVYELQAQNGTAITSAYQITEKFSNYAHSTSYTSGTKPADFTTNISANGLVQDLMYLGKPLPACLGSDDNESFDQSFVVTISGTQYTLTTVNHVSRGRFAGTYKVDVTITTP
jgi:hypothetical protein